MSSIGLIVVEIEWFSCGVGVGGEGTLEMPITWQLELLKTRLRSRYRGGKEGC